MKQDITQLECRGIGCRTCGARHRAPAARSARLHMPQQCAQRACDERPPPLPSLRTVVAPAQLFTRGLGHCSAPGPGPVRVSTERGGEAPGLCSRRMAASFTAWRRGVWHLHCAGTCVLAGSSGGAAGAVLQPLSSRTPVRHALWALLQAYRLQNGPAPLSHRPSMRGAAGPFS